MKPAIIIICVLHCCIALAGQVNVVDVPLMGVGPKPVHEYSIAAYGDKFQGVVELTSDLTRTFFEDKRFFAIYTMDRMKQAMVSQGGSRSVVSFAGNKVEPAGAALTLKEVSVPDVSVANRVVQLYSHLYARSLITPEIAEFAKLNLVADHILQIVTVPKGIRATAHFGSRAAIEQVVFLMTKSGTTIESAKEIFRSIYYR